jgi:CMP-N-acetylneuraminic acid synthetase
MKVVAMMPFWSNYESSQNALKCIPLLNLGGKPLISRTVELFNQIKLIDEVVIFTSDNQVTNYINEKAKCNFLKRDHSLDSNESSIEDIIESFLLLNNADIIVLVNPKSPFLMHQTIEECVEQVLSLKFDSAFTANSIRKHIWFRDEPLNYSQNQDTPALSKIDPVIVETSSIYVFTRDLFNKNRRRIGKNPYIKEIGHFEGFEIEREDDYKMAELIINAGLDRERN